MYAVARKLQPSDLRGSTEISRFQVPVTLLAWIELQVNGGLHENRAGSSI